MKGKWMQQFKKRGTVDGNFFLSNGETVKTKFMRQTSHFNYVSCKKDNFALAFLPYKAKNVDYAWEMGILLPERGLNPADFLKFLKYDSLKQLRSDAKLEELDIKLPPVKIESTIDLIPMFQKLGVESAFADNADFSGICENKEIRVSDIVQKCFVEIDEEGTEAAAATAIQATEFESCLGLKDEPIRFHVTSSYLYFIYQPESEIVLFSGIVRKPTCIGPYLGKRRGDKINPDDDGANKKFCTIL
jgi:serine protease inhibitor